MHRPTVPTPAPLSVAVFGLWGPVLDLCFDNQSMSIAPATLHVVPQWMSLGTDDERLQDPVWGVAGRPVMWMNVLRSELLKWPMVNGVSSGTPQVPPSGFSPSAAARAPRPAWLASSVGRPRPARQCGVSASGVGGKTSGSPPSPSAGPGERAPLGLAPSSSPSAAGLRRAGPPACASPGDLLAALPPWPSLGRLSARQIGIRRAGRAIGRSPGKTA
mmetsp:Transcript_105690/g.299225  ORF Transcript_105690/g.299225 Transcript_105690/m.299225 type:complete len:217 (-) Transcript_105690:1363-2013(-)